MNAKFKRAPADCKLTEGGYAHKVTGELLQCGKFTKAECDEFNGVKAPKVESPKAKK